jgi:L-lactate dehydrogenase (cytochrome)
VHRPGAKATSLSRCFNISDLRRIAKRRLPRPIFDYMDGGAEDERTLVRNHAAFADYELVPDVLTDVSSIELATTIFGKPAALPLLLSPTGLTRMFHGAAELAVARAASAAGLPYALSTVGTTTIEDFARAMSAPTAFQIYVFKDRGLTREFVARCRDAGVDALILTVDTVVAGRRERDLRSGLSMPPRLTAASFLSFALHPTWSLPALTGTKFEFVNVRHRTEAMGAGSTSLFDYMTRQFDRTLTWADAEWLAQAWGGPLLIKGVSTGADARRALDAGATGVMVSNHGGRQLEDAPAPIDQVAEAAAAIGGKGEVICDGGVRRGGDIVKALAMGATACSIGRPYLYGLAAGGEAGVCHALTLLRDELERTLILLGVSDVRLIEPRHVRALSGAPFRASPRFAGLARTRSYG